MNSLNVMDAIDSILVMSDEEIKAGFRLKNPPRDIRSLDLPLYRGDSRPPHEIFTEGFQAKGKNYDIFSHVRGSESGFVSTSKSALASTHFPDSATVFIYDLNKSYLYEVYPDPGVDINRKMLRGTPAQKLGHITDYGKEFEVAIRDRIAPSQIKSCVDVDINRTPTDISRIATTNKYDNPLFVPSKNRSRTLWNAGRYAGKAIMATGLALDGYSIVEQYQISTKTGRYGNTRKEVARVAAGWTGAYYGGSAGATYGASLASYGGPYGTVVGGVAGGLVGSGIGYFVGSEAVTGTLVSSAKASDKNVNQSMEIPYEPIEFIDYLNTPKGSGFACYQNRHLDYVIKKLKRDKARMELNKKHESKNNNTDAIVKQATRDVLSLNQSVKKMITKPSLDLEITTSIQERLITARQSINGAATILDAFGVEHVAEIQAVGNATITVCENLGGLLGVESLAAFSNPLTAIPSIVGAVSSVIKMFGQKRQSDPSKNIMIAIQRLSLLISDFRADVHNRFNDMSDKLDEQHREILDQFALIHTNNREILSGIRMIYFSIERGFSAQSALLSNIIDSLDEIKCFTYNREMKEAHNKLKELLGETTRTITDYNKIMSLAQVYALTHSIGHQLKSPLKIMDERNPAAYLNNCIRYYAELLRQSPFSLEKTLRNSSGEESNVASPIMLVYATLIVLRTLYREYPVPDADDNSERVSHLDIERLRDLLKMYDRVKNVLLSSSKIELLFKAHHRNSELLSEAISKAMKEIDEQTTELYQVKYDEQYLSEFSQNVKDFNSPEPSTFGWYRGTRRRLQRWHNGSWGISDVTNPYVEENMLRTFRNTRRESFRVNLSTSLRVATETYTKSRTFTIKSFFPELICSSNLYIPFLTSEAPNLIPLPALVGLNFGPYTEAVYYGIGKINGSYVIKNGQLTLSYVFTFSPAYASNESTTKHTLVQLTINDYNPYCYSGIEALWNWWYGGQFPKSSRGVEILKAEGPTFDQALCGGGHGHKNGEFTRTEIKYESPTSVRIFGAKLRLSKLKYNIPKSELVRSLIKQKQKELQQRSCLQLKNRLNVDDPILGLALKKYEESYRNLFGALSVCFYDQMSDSNSALFKQFDQQYWSVSQLKNMLSSGHCKLTEMLTGSISIGSNSKSTSFKIFDVMHSLLSETIEAYEPYAVENNKNNVNQKDMSDITGTLFGVCEILTGNVLKVSTPESAKAIISPVLSYLDTQLEKMPNSAQQEFLRRLKEQLKDSSLKLTYKDKKMSIEY